MSNLENSIKKIGYDFGCKNLSETHDSITKLFSYPDKEDIITKINTMTNKFDKVQFMEKFKGTISEDSIVKSENEINANLVKIKKYMGIDTKDIHDLRIIYNYLMQLNKLYEYDPGKKHCNIIDIYMKYSDIIHLMILISSPIFYDMIQHNVPLLTTQRLFNRCYYTVQSFLYLIGESKSIEQDILTPVPFKGQSYRHTTISVSNTFTLSNLINNSVSIPMYYLKIGTYHRILDHTFIIVKYNDGAVPKYTIIQSYIGEYCPKTKNYTHDEIIIMVIELSEIFYDDTGKISPDVAIMSPDLTTWKKYFFVDLREQVRGATVSCTAPSCITYVFGIIDEQLCYSSIYRLIKKSEHTINSYLNELLFPLAKKMEIDMKSIYYMIPIDKYLSLQYIGPTDYTIRKKNTEIEIELDWSDIVDLYTDMPMITTLFRTYQIHDVKSFFSFLTLLERFVALKHDINMSAICHSNIQGGNDGPTYKDKYLKYKYKYLSMKGSSST